MIKYTYIIAEDEERIRKNLIKKINAHDERFMLLDEAFNGEQALAGIHRKQPDILFTDIRMPGMDGLKLIENIYYQYPDICIVIISGYEDFSYAQRAIQFGVFDYLLKPVKIGELAGTLVKLAVHIAKKHSEMKDNAAVYSSNLSGKALAQGVMEYLRSHYTEDISIQSLAGQFYVNPTYMTRIVKEYSGKTPTRFITDLRIQQAKHLIISAEKLEIKEIAYASGYSDQGYFTRVFKKATGKSPSDYRADYKNR
ncbi:MAG: response regulator [Spirochaetia bacterium]|nr:response regulator [Spirochaetia bacterium]